MWVMSLRSVPVYCAHDKSLSRKGDFNAGAAPLSAKPRISALTQ